MTVVFLPDYTGSNPYQTNLAEALDEEVSFGGRGRFLPILGVVRSTEDVSVVHFHWTHPYIHAGSRAKTAVQLALTVSQLLVLRAWGVPMAWTVHNVVSHGSRYPRVERRFKHAFVRFGFCDVLFVHCEAVEDSVIEAYGLPEDVRERIRVIPHGHFMDNYENDLTRADARAALGLDPEETVFLYFGEIHPYKGVPNLIDAFESATVPDSRLLIVGKPISDALERTIREESATDDRIRTVPEFVPAEHVQRYMNASDCVVLPYNAITTSGSAILAMSFGKAIIIPRRGCVPEQLDEEGSLMYSPGNEDGLRTALAEAPERDLVSMGEHNQRLVRQYDWAEIAETTSREYARLR